MKKSKSFVALLLVMLILGNLIGGCAQSANKPVPAPATPAPEAKSNVKNQDTIVYAVSEQPTSMDPHIAYDPESMCATSNAYEGLVTYKGAGSEIIPLLAESWETQENGKVWVFKLRKGVKFHDGTPFTAEAVKINFERLLKINEGPAWMFDMITKVEAVDENTAKFTLAYAFVPFLHALANPAGPFIVSPKAIADHQVSGDLAKGWLKENMVGTGPYKLEKFNVGQDVTLAKFDDYWGGWSGKHVSKILLKVV